MANAQQLLAQLAKNAPQSDPFEVIYRGAREIDAAEKSCNVRKLAELDFSVTPHCIKCYMPCMDIRTKQYKPLRCGGCKAVIYCSKKCQVADWKNPPAPNTPSHKENCSRNAEHMKRLPDFRSVAEQFPWVRIETDGTFSHDLLKARLGVLGSGPSYGYWSVPGGNDPHDPSSTYRTIDRPKAAFIDIDTRLNPRTKEYVHGAALLDKEWGSDVKAWKLKDEKLTPLLAFNNEGSAPENPKLGEVKDWASWHQWRGLGMNSPASLLLDGPLSVYQLLVNVLKVVDTDSTPTSRQQLNVHLLGADVELNFLPLFSELALLLPNTDITLTLFGKAVYDLVDQARDHFPGSLATRSTVWSYTAPEKTGGGSIAIKLYAEAESWTRTVLAGGANLPHAMVGLNAGLLSYTGWEDPIIFSALCGIPFAVTEYAEQSLETTVRELPHMWEATVRQFTMMTGGLSAKDISALKKKRPHPIAPNPFHRPGQRPLPVIRLPNFYNGFTTAVVLSDKVERELINGNPETTECGLS